MNWRRVREGFLAIAAAGAIATAGAVLAGEEALKESMDKALDDLQPLLVALINADYEAGLGNIEPILEHASKLSEMIPDDAKDRRDEYLAYSYNLTKNAAVLKSLLTAIVHDEKASKSLAGSTAEFFPIVAATHYGGIVDMCVTCHHSFRLKIDR